MSEGVSADPERGKSPRRAMCAAVLTLEAIVVALSSAVMITLGGVDKGLALGCCLGLAVLCLLGAGLLRAEWGYAVGWLLQAGAVALGLLTPTMWFLGALFALLWGTAYFLGRRIEDERAAAFAAYDEQQESAP